MRVVLLSKALVRGAYQRKAEEIARLGVELTVLVPPRWTEAGRTTPLERAFTSGYDLIELPIAFDGHYHYHFYPTLGRLLDRLQAKGWVRREHDAADRRVWRVHLTDEVEPALRTMRRIAAELRRDALTGISAAERERFVDTLLAIKENLR